MELETFYGLKAAVCLFVAGVVLVCFSVKFLHERVMDDQAWSFLPGQIVVLLTNNEDKQLGRRYQSPGGTCYNTVSSGESTGPVGVTELLLSGLIHSKHVTSVDIVT